MEVKLFLMVQFFKLVTLLSFKKYKRNCDGNKLYLAMTCHWLLCIIHISILSVSAERQCVIFPRQIHYNLIAIVIQQYFRWRHHEGGHRRICLPNVFPPPSQYFSLSPMFFLNFPCKSIPLPSLGPKTFFSIIVSDKYCPVVPKLLTFS